MHAPRDAADWPWAGDEPGDVHSTAHRCVDCDSPADWKFFNRDGSLYGYICEPCDDLRRRRRMGWRRRLKRGFRHTFGT